MDIVFVYPGYENIGIEYLSAVLKKGNHRTFLIFDPVLFNDSGGINIPFLSRCFDLRNRILKKISNIKPGLVCFSVVTDNFSWALETAKLIKRTMHIPIVFGGVHPTAVPEIVIKYDCVDFVCVGEGEGAIVELADSLENEHSVYNIKNVWVKQGNNIVANKLRPLIANLDSLPFADKDIYYSDLSFIFQGYTIATSRGCPNMCSYCANSLMREIYKDKGAYLRRRSVQNVLEELEGAKQRYKPKYVHFLDEVFTYDKKWLSDFVSDYRKKINLPFMCYISPQFADKEIISLLKEGGCYKVQMGVQTLNETKRINLLNRNYSNSRVSYIIDECRRNKIYITCDNILGLPGQDERELLEMAFFYSLHKPNNIEIFYLRYYPRTKIVTTVYNKGLLNNESLEKIDNGLGAKGIARGGDVYNAGLGRFQLLMNLIHFMPKSWYLFIINKKLYRYFPALPPIFITVFFRFLNKAKYDFYVSNTIRKYILFIFGKPRFNFN